MDKALTGVLFLLLTMKNCVMSHELDRRLCGDDYITHSRCFVYIQKNLDWDSAIQYCGQNLSKPGLLASIEDKSSQILVQGEVNKNSGNDVWINGYRNYRRWRWQGHFEDYGFQGCWKEDPFNPDLPILVPTNSSTKPSDCLRVCGQEHTFLSVKTDSSGNLICRCADAFGQYGRSYDAHCDAPCSSPGSMVIDKTCGTPEHQLIYQVNGEITYHNFAPANTRQYDHCVVFDHNLGHKWAEHSCLDELPFICHHWDNEDFCLTRSSYIWRAGTCFTIQTEPKNFYEAQEVCGRFDGLLLQVPNQDLNDEVASLLSADKSYFIALHDDEFLFSDWNLMYRFFNWAPGQPTYQAKKSCLSMKQSDFYWYNRECNTQLPFVCMVDIGEEHAEATSVPDGTTTPADTTTTGSNSGLSKDLIIGVGAGAGGALLLVILIVLCVCFIKRGNHQKALREQNANRRTHRERKRRNISRVSNPAYQPDVIVNHKPGKSASRSSNSGSDGTYSGESNHSYLSLGDRKSNHTYDSIKPDHYEYIDHPRRY